MQPIFKQVSSSVRYIGNDIKEQLTQRAIKHLKITNQNLVVTLDPIHLVNGKRLDLIAKYIYAQYQAWQVSSDWALKLYCENIKILNGFVEPDGSGKQGKEAFLKAFDTLLESVEQEGFDPTKSIVPVLSPDFLIDGGHRVAACLVYKSDVAAIIAESSQECFAPCDYIYYQERLFNKVMLDAMALQYCLLKKNSRLLLIFSPNPVDSDLIKKAINSFGNVVYERDIYLWKKGLKNLNYYLNTSCNFFDNDPEIPIYFGLTKLYLIDGESNDIYKNIESRVQELLDHPSYTYIPKTQKQNIELSQLLLNHNSVNILNRCSQKSLRKMSSQIQPYQEFIDNSSINADFLCIVGDPVLSIHGMKNHQHFTFYQHQADQINCDHKNLQQIKCGVTQDELIFNPDHYFYYQGLKFATLKSL